MDCAPRVFRVPPSTPFRHEFCRVVGREKIGEIEVLRCREQSGRWRSFAVQAVCALTVASSALVCQAAVLVPQDPAARLAQSSFILHSSPGVGDFDGDNRADIAFAKPQGRVNGAWRYQIEVRLSTEPGATFDVDSGAAGGLRITTRDVDGDHDLDLVITSAFGGLRVGVWINDGHGQFTQGEAESYPLSIWQEPDRVWEAPEEPNPPSVTFTLPAGNSSIQPARLEIPVLARTERSLHAAGGTYRRKTLNSGSPFRAPPIS